MPPKPKPVVERFWSHVAVVSDADSCWLWIGATNPRGYGVFKNDSGTEGAHRFSYKLAYGDIPDITPYVLHTCDVRACVRPTHLYLGTQADNMQDKASRNNQGRLSQEEVAEARLLYSSGGATYSDLAVRYRVSYSVVWDAVNYRTRFWG